MVKPYSMELRERVVAAAREDGMPFPAAAARFDVAGSSAIKWVRRVRATGSVAPSWMGKYKPNIVSDGGADRRRVSSHAARTQNLRLAPSPS